MSALSARAQLRRELRQGRVAISNIQRRQGAQQVARRLARLPLLQRAKHVAAYSAMGSEINLQPWLALADQRGKRIYWPRIRQYQMDFYPASNATQRNRHGISEPHRTRVRPLWSMSVVLLPLLGFDAHGNRLGQGGGYYDRALSRLRWRRPWLIGVAFDEQHCAHIPVADWDQPLDGVVTPTQTLIFRK